MSGGALRSILEISRAEPVEAALYATAPAVAAVQLLNSLVNGLSYLVSIPFAVVLLAFTALVVGHRISQRRLADLEVDGPDPALE